MCTRVGTKFGAIICRGHLMKIIRSKRTVAWLNNRTNLNPPKLFSTLGKKGLTKEDKDATVYKQLEFNFMRAQ